MPSTDIHSPLRDAVRQMAGRRVTPSGMTSREWEALQAEIRLRAMFSSTVENERVLAEAQARIHDYLANVKRDGATMDRSRFVVEMREILREEGYRRPDGTKKDSLRNLKSTRRLELIWNMNVAQAAGYAQWVSAMTPEGLENEPCYEFIRVMDRAEVREWPLVWQKAGGQFYDGEGSNDDYPRAAGRMIAKKTDPIWVTISRFGTPWAPFDWGSGMGLRGVGADEAEAFGIVGADEKPQAPLVVPFNTGHQISLKKLPPSSRERLRSDLGDAIRIDNDQVILQRETTPETDEQRNQDIPRSLRERAREYYLQARDRLDKIRREDDGTEVAFPGEIGEYVSEIYLAQASAVAVGRKQVFHDTMPQADAEAFLAACNTTFPPHVAMSYDDVTGDMLVWRRDLMQLVPSVVNTTMLDGKGGLLLGYGLDLPAWVSKGPRVAVGIFRLPRSAGDEPLGGFDAPIDGWEAFAKARARDFADALGIKTEITWEVYP